MTDPLGPAEAEALVVKHLGESPRARHSRVVGALMAWLAKRYGGDVGVWQTTGLVHDIDYVSTASEPHRHGPMAAEWLAGRLPDDALLAIAAHDHRSGIESSFPIADALKLADALAVLDEGAGREATVSALQAGTAALRELVGKRDYLAAMVESFAARLGIALAELPDALTSLPRQD